MNWLFLLGIVLGLLVGGGIAVYPYITQRRQLEARQQEQAGLQAAQEQLRADRNRLQAEQKELQSEQNRLEQAAQRTLQDRQRQLDLQFKEELQRQRDVQEVEFEKRRERIKREEEVVERRRTETEQRNDRLNKLDQHLAKRQSQLDKRTGELEKADELFRNELQRVASLTAEQAKAELLAKIEQEARNDMARIVRQVEEEAREEGERRARKIVVTAMQRIATAVVADNVTSVVEIPSDEMKGRIIGRAGRNIRALEQAAGVDVIVDDTPEVITISSFDPIRREVGKRAINKLVQDGRIHPSQIEKVVADARKEVDASIKESGEQAAYDAGVPNLPAEILRLLGMLNFRTSYGQNQNAHSVETALLAGAIAAELGADVELAKAGGLLHDLGKAVDHEVEGTHAAIGAELARRYKIHPVIQNCIAAHHHEVEQLSLEAVIVEIADAISGARPGARRESLEQYIKRIRALEEIGRANRGVEECFALQAGREVRIIVRPEQVDDYAADQIAKSVARKIEESMQYPGQVKVTVIRETRATDYAK
jgi:ribonuclease Y